MTVTSYPFENTDTDEAQYTLLFREFIGSGILDTYGGTGFQVTGSGSSLQVSVAAGDAIVRGHMARNDGTVNLSVDSNSSGSTRYDRIVLRLNPGANEIALAYVKPSVGAGPPTLSQTDTSTYELPLAKIAVANGAANLSGVVTDERPWISGRIGIWTTDTRPGETGYAPSPRRGVSMGYNVTLNRWEYWNGSEWTQLIPSVTAVSNWTSMTGTDYQLHVGTSAPGSPTTTTLWVKPTA